MPPDEQAMWQILTTDERQRLTALLARLPLLLTGAADGRHAFLSNNGLGDLASRLPLNETAEVFVARLVALAESAGEPLADPHGLHPLGAVCEGVLRLEDASPDDHPFLAGLILQYELIEDAKAADGLRARVGAPAGVTPWRAARRQLPPGGTAYYSAPPRGLDPLPFTLRTNVGNFLRHYLGTAEHPTPFGGRDTDLARLEQWRTESSRRFLLLAAPAGRGKSALLARWADGLSRGGPEAPAVIFMPISTRFGTNAPELVFPSIAAQLAELLGEEAPAHLVNAPPGFWQNLVGEYLRRPLPDGRPLLLIVDGLDEAAWEIGPALFPLDLPPTTRVVVSARLLGDDPPGFGPWLGRLGWERGDVAAALALEALSRDGVRDVLANMGRPLDELADREWLIDRLFALTGGDPLLVELYVDWLFERGPAVAHLRPEELEGMRPGYKGFFDHWWQAQQTLWRQQGRGDPTEKALVMELLRVLAVALGPLGAADLPAVLPGPAPARHAIRQAVEPLRRFVVGHAAAGYVLAHPRLGEYFREEFFSPEEIRGQEAAFVQWGQAAIAAQPADSGQWSVISAQTAAYSSSIPSYLLRYYSHHLKQASAPPETFLELLSAAWLEAWHRLSGTYDGFLRDVDAVLEQLTIADRAAVERGELAPYLGYEVLCALCHASVNGLAANMPTELLVALRRFGGWSD